MFFLAFSNVNVLFTKQELTRRSYNTTKAIPITKRMEFINKKEFVKAALDENVEAFVVYIMFFSLIHPAQKAQIAFLLTKKVKIPTKYLDFLDIFLEKRLWSY